MKLHLYSDLNLRYFQYADPVDEVVPAATDLVVVAGNISRDVKRSLLFQETLSSNKRPVVVNIGLEESFNTAYYDAVNALLIRYAAKPEFDCHYAGKGSGIQVSGLDVMTYAGWYHEWDEQAYRQGPLSKFKTEVKFGILRNDIGQVIGYVEKTETTLDYYNQFVSTERARVLEWLKSDNGLPKLLVCGGDAQRALGDQDLTGIIVCATGTEFLDTEFNGGRLLCNPGSGAEARSRLFDI